MAKADASMGLAHQGLTPMPATAARWRSLAKAVETGYTVPAALRSNPWLSRLRGEGRLDALLARADLRRQQAARAFRDNGVEELLGALNA